MPREQILGRIRTALGRAPGEPALAPPPSRIVIPQVGMEDRIASMRASIEALAGRTARAAAPQDACALVAEAIAGKSAVTSNSPYLAECGITRLPGVRSGITDRDELRAACAAADVGITSADYALADTGALVMIASPQEARLISLLPPAHIAVVPKDRILTGLGELFTILPNPAEQTSSMVLITGPSRTGDIELILVRGVHGPGQISVVIVG